MHPAGADASIHAGAALRTEEEKDILVSSSVGYYGAQNALQGKCCRSSASAAPFMSLQAVMKKEGAPCLQQGKELSLCFTGHISHVGLEVQQQSSDGTVISNHRLQSDVAQPALSMGRVAARLLSSTAGSATAIASSAGLPASAQSKVSTSAPTSGSPAPKKDSLTSSA